MRKLKCMTVVDCVDFQCLDIRLPNGELDTSLYSHKHNGPGLKYEICHGIYTGNICWVNGPFKAGEFNDLQVAKEFGLCAMLSASGEKAIADGIYKDQEFFHTPPGIRTPQSRAMNTLRARQETINARLKTNWGCFKTTWRHDHELHELAVTAALTIMQLEFDNKIKKLFKVPIKPPATGVDKERLQGLANRQVARLYQQDLDPNKQQVATAVREQFYAKKHPERRTWKSKHKKKRK